MFEFVWGEILLLGMFSCYLQTEKIEVSLLLIFFMYVVSG